MKARAAGPIPSTEARLPGSPAGRSLGRMVFHRILLGIDAFVAVVFAWFFLEGLGDGSVSSFNGLLWFGTLATLAVVLGGGIALGRRGRIAAANALLLVLALPALGFVLFFMLLVGSGGRWQ